MTQTRTKKAVLEADFLAMRAKILEIAAGLDRFDRAPGEWPEDPRRQRIDEAIQLLLSDDADRAEQVQLLFSRPHDDSWRKKLGI